MKWLSSIVAVLILAVLLFAFANGNSRKEAKPLDTEVHSYWTSGVAEVTSYNLKQARYGEIHEGTAALVFVSEPFSTSSWTKADAPQSEDQTVLKLNFTKKFNTGVYPYSMMTSTVFPLAEADHSLKISSSQEWCGHTFMDLKNKRDFEVSINSYFENESANLTIDKALLEDDVWTKIRLFSASLPLGDLQMIPSFMYLRLRHQETKAYAANAKLIDAENGNSVYEIEYPTLKRSLKIEFEKTFPNKIIAWEESYISGWGESAKELKTTATRIKTIRSDYWNKHAVKDSLLRQELGL